MREICKFQKKVVPLQQKYNIVNQNMILMSHENLHIGALIRAELTRQGRTVQSLSDALCIHRPNCYRILRNPSIDTDQLLLISRILHHDFFAEYSKCLAETPYHNC